MLISFLSAVFFFITYLSSGHKSFLFLVPTVLIAGALIWNRYYLKKQQHFTYTWMLAIAGITWLFMPFLPWVGIPIVMLALLENKARLALVIRFSDEGIVFNSLFRKKFLWNEFDNIVLKDGIITLDFKSNRLFQKEIVDDGAYTNQEDTFNQFCASRLK
ncbi:MAG: hypothetical protein WKF89_00795 [Chitinophagaceae bacterium]